VEKWDAVMAEVGASDTATSILGKQMEQMRSIIKEIMELLND